MIGNHLEDLFHWDAERLSKATDHFSKDGSTVVDITRLLRSQTSQKILYFFIFFGFRLFFLF